MEKRSGLFAWWLLHLHLLLHLLLLVSRCSRRHSCPLRACGSQSQSQSQSQGQKARARKQQHSTAAFGTDCSESKSLKASPTGRLHTRTRCRTTFAALDGSPYPRISPSRRLRTAVCSTLQAGLARRPRSLARPLLPSHRVGFDNPGLHVHVGHPHTSFAIHTNIHDPREPPPQHPAPLDINRCLTSSSSPTSTVIGHWPMVVRPAHFPNSRHV